MATTTSQIITRVKDFYLPKWSRANLLDLLNQVQKELCLKDCSQTTFHTFTDDTFPFPFLNTTAGTLSYDITGANLKNSDGAAVSIVNGSHAVVARRVRRVFIEVSSVGSDSFDRKFYGQEFMLSGVNEYWSRILNKVQFYEVPIKPFDRTETNACRLLFVEDPGTYADRYYVEFFVNPIELEAETDTLSVDADKWGAALVDGVVGLAEDSMYGRSERLDKFRDVWAKRWTNQANVGIEKMMPLKFRRRPIG